MGKSEKLRQRLNVSVWLLMALIKTNIIYLHCLNCMRHLYRSLAAYEYIRFVFGICNRVYRNKKWNIVRHSFILFLNCKCSDIMIKNACETLGHEIERLHKKNVVSEWHFLCQTTDYYLNKRIKFKFCLLRYFPIWANRGLCIFITNSVFDLACWLFIAIQHHFGGFFFA